MMSKLFEKGECNWQGISCYERNVSAILRSEYDMQLIHLKLIQYAHDAIFPCRGHQPGRYSSSRSGLADIHRRVGDNRLFSFQNAPIRARKSENFARLDLSKNHFEGSLPFSLGHLRRLSELFP